MLQGLQGEEKKSPGVMVLKNLFQSREGINKGLSAGGLRGYQDVFPCSQMVDGFDLMGVETMDFQAGHGFLNIGMKAGRCSVRCLAGGNKMLEYKGLAEIGMGL